MGWLSALVWLALWSAPLRADPGPLGLEPIEVAVRDGEGGSRLELRPEGTTLRVRWIRSNTAWEATCAQTHSGPERTWRGPLVQVQRAGLKDLGASTAAPSSPLELVLVRDLRERILGKVLRGTGRGQRTVHELHGLFPVRLGGRWLPRLQPRPAPSGWLDGFTRKDPYVDDEGLPPPQPQQRRLGALAVLVCGMFNMPPSRAFVERTAAHAERVLLVYTNPYPLQHDRLRPLTHLDGQPLAVTARGRVFALGNPAPLISPWPASSDRLLEALERVRAADADGGRDLFAARVTLIGHSQGSLAVLLTRQRVEAAGLVEPGSWQVLALAPPFRGASWSDSELVRWACVVVSPLAPGLRDAVESLSPSVVSRLLGGARADVVVTGYTLEPGQGAPDRSDGVVTVESARSRARRFASLAGHDHASIFRAPAALERAVRTLGP